MVLVVISIHNVSGITCPTSNFTCLGRWAMLNQLMSSPDDQIYGGQNELLYII